MDDDLDQDGFVLANDCNDENADINPSATDIPDNGIDEDCDGEDSTLIVDNDGDGFDNTVDCDDSNSDINPSATEIPYNGIDEDCDPLTLDDDLDQDGFVLAEDCDDNNVNINPSSIETPYNGIDEDCNPLTLDDDLDQDGFVLAEDCDDLDATINPEAEDVPNNGLDENCDGEDTTTSTITISEVTFKIYPNPASDLLYIEYDSGADYIIEFYNLKGQLAMRQFNKKKVDVTSLSPGVYLLKLINVSDSKSALTKINIH